jgi:hypothetical protein
MTILSNIASLVTFLIAPFFMGYAVGAADLRFVFLALAGWATFFIRIWMLAEEKQP